MTRIGLDTASRVVARGARMARLLILPLLIVLAFASGGQAQTQAPSEDVTLTKAQLEQLVAPIALYPDSLLTQVLMASTYPLEIVQAARWATNNSKLTGKALEDALQKQSWDPSIKSIVAVPDVLKMMNEKLEWTETLGNAFLAQQDDLMGAVQALRARAEASGSLKTTPQQKVSKQTTSSGQATVIIEPADPEVIYVPAYDPGVVYGEWPYPDYPPYEWYPTGYYGGAGWWWGGRVLAGAAIWAGWNWANHHVDINPHRYNSFNKTNIANPSWKHDVAHRKGVPYKNANVAKQFGQTGRDVGKGSSSQLKTQAKSQVKSQAKSQVQSQAKTQAKSQAKTQAKSQAKTQAKSQVKTQAKSQVKTQAKTQAKSQVKTQAKTQAKSQVKSQAKAAGPSRQARPSTVGRAPSARPAGGGAPRVSSGGGRGGSVGRGGGGRRSDIELKHDIVLLGRLDNGLGLYRFSYNGSEKSYVGVLAQEVQTVMPNAVMRGSDGYLRVFYDRIGVKLQTYDHWLRTGARVHVEPAHTW